MNFPLTIAIIIIAALLSSCSPPIVQRTEVVEKKTMVVASLDESLLADCKSSEPPSLESYLAANRDSKEDQLTKYVIKLLTYNTECSLNSRAVKDQLKSQRDKIQKYNEEEEARIQSLLKSKGQEEKP